MWGWLTALLRGILEPLIASWQQKQHGRTAQQRDDAVATLDTEREIADALQRDDGVRADRRRAVADLLRRELGRAASRDDRPTSE